MKTSERFTNAVTKLYNAFHNGELNAMNPCCCAIGNLCDGSDEWRDITCTDNINGYEIPKIWQDYTGYSEIELFNIEALFMYGVKYNTDGLEWTADQINVKYYPDKVFKALCAVVEYLCEIEGIPNVMDYTCLFETENNELKKQLNEVFYDSI